MIAPLLFGLVGAAVLLGLGFWQLDRLVWKSRAIDAIAARIDQSATSLPGQPDEARDEYLAVAASGRFDGSEIHVLTSRTQSGPGYRVIAAFETDGRRVLVDRGFIPQDQKDQPRPARDAEILGNLLWPDEIDPTFTPQPDLAKNIWFARDLPAMAAHLQTEPVLIVQSRPMAGGGDVKAWPVTSTSLRNDHLSYAITWFSLAVFWLGMTVYWLWRISQRLD